MKIRRKTPPRSTIVEARSAYAASLETPDRARYRCAPDRDATVADIVTPGTAVRTSYGTGGVVVRVEQWSFTAYTGEAFSHHTIVYVPADRQHRYRDSEIRSLPTAAGRSNPSDLTGPCGQAGKGEGRPVGVSRAVEREPPVRRFRSLRRSTPCPYHCPKPVSPPWFPTIAERTFCPTSSASSS
ncbi:hypothetical protein [Chelativorans oligotrophicus]|uniref:hypothetical protein n=1 Tax=Chelativorans oligotrophicus TaxID=449974 RepID=UPI001A9949DD|nr:hypothetical protein [Chelativorans oligotrophicus]